MNYIMILLTIACAVTGVWCAYAWWVEGDPINLMAAILNGYAIIANVRLLLEYW